MVAISPKNVSSRPGRLSQCRTMGLNRQEAISTQKGQQKVPFLMISSRIETTDGREDSMHIVLLAVEEKQLLS